MKYNRKPIPRLITVFGATGHLGGPVAKHAQQHAPDVKLRLVTSAPEKAEALQTGFPKAEVVIANYFDEASMTAALANAEGAFLVTPNFLDEEQAMPIFIRAAKAAGSLSHIVRLLGDAPGMTLDRVATPIREFMPQGPATQHLLAHGLLKASGLPVTYINCASYMMDNFLGAVGRPLREQHKLIVPVDRLNSFIDPRDVGETAACLLLSDNHRHIGHTYDLDNDHDVLRFSDVADLMTEVLGVKITYDGTPESFLRELGPRYRARMGIEKAAEYMVMVFEFEREHEIAWRRSDAVESIIGRKPTTLHEWLLEHKEKLVPPQA